MKKTTEVRNYGVKSGPKTQEEQKINAKKGAAVDDRMSRRAGTKKNAKGAAVATTTECPGKL